jgi:hypothetical protein
MGLSFATPWMLFGLSLLALPVLAHLTGYREVKKVSFPTLRFLQASQVKSRRRTRIQSLLLLLVRMLLVMCLVLLVARPSLQWTTAGLAGLDPERPSVILIDTSASASVLVAGTPLFSLLVSEAEDLLNGLADGTPAAVLAFDDRTRALGHGLTPDHSSLRRELLSLKPGAGATDLDQALRRARSLLRDQELGAASIFVLSDGTASVLPSGLAESWPEQLRVHYFDLRRAPVHNRFVEAVKAQPPGTQGTGLRIEVQALSVGDSPAPTVAATLRLQDGLEVHQDLGFADGSAQVSFTLPIPPIGDQVAVLEIGEDDLPLDDQYPFILRGDTSVEVLLVSGEGGAQPRDDEAYFIEKALQPGSGSPSRVHPRVVSAEALRQFAGGEGDVVFLCNVTDPRPIAEDLLSMVEAGGGLFISVGRQTDPDLYNEALGPLLPSRFTEVKTRGGGSFEISPVGLALPPLDRDEFRVFRTGGASVFSQVRFGQMIATEPALAKDSRVLLRYTDGLPALLERRVGKGRVILFTSSIDDDWTDLPLRSIFVPLIHQIARSLSNTLVHEAEDVIEVGQSVALSLPPDPRREAWLRGPQQEEIRLDPMGADEEGLMSFSEARTPGHYSLFWSDPDSGTEQLKGRFSVRVPTRESKLTALSARLLHEAVPGLVYHGGARQESGAESPGEVVRTSSLLPALWLCLLLALIGESLLSFRRG